MLAPSTHPVQLSLLGLVVLFNIVGLLAVNRAKETSCTNVFNEKGGSDAPVTADRRDKEWTWGAKSATYRLTVIVPLLAGCYLDCRYDTSSVFIDIRAFVFAYPVGLLDLYLARRKSSATRVPPVRAVAGAALWCLAGVLRGVAAGYLLNASDLTLVISSPTVRSLLEECLRVAAAALVIGFCSDLVFSPLHRLMHRPGTYDAHHRTHHEYTEDLTCLVLYHGAYLDDVLMALQTVVSGSVLYQLLAGLVGMERRAVSNAALQLLHVNALLAHAHDVRCAGLVVPLPDGLNFAAYHRIHHKCPHKNFGLTKPSDVIWDALLGQDTILNPKDFQEKRKR